MTDTATRPIGASQFCGSCGAPVKVYWSACENCQAPIGVAPVGSFDSISTTARPADPSATQIVSSVAPAPTAAPYPLPRRSYGSAAPSYVPAAAPLPPQQSFGGSPTSYRSPLEDYQPPTDWSSTARLSQLPPAATFTPRDTPPSKRASKGTGGVWIVVAVVLAVLLLGVGIFAGVSASGLSSKNSKLSAETKLYTHTSQQLKAAQSQLNVANAANANQSSELAAYKQCISDESAVDAADFAGNKTAARAAQVTVIKDCIPLGLS
jgi:hypothetical protein